MTLSDPAVGGRFAAKAATPCAPGISFSHVRLTATRQWWDGIRWTGEVRDADDASGAEAPAAGQASAGAPRDAPGAPAAWRAATRPAAPGEEIPQV
jgi:hypothetical protein